MSVRDFEVLLGRSAYRVQVDSGGVLIIWHTGKDDFVLGRGRVEKDGLRYKVKDPTTGISEPLIAAIERALSPID